MRAFWVASFAKPVRVTTPSWATMDTSLLAATPLARRWDATLSASTWLGLAAATGSLAGCWAEPIEGIHRPAAAASGYRARTFTRNLLVREMCVVKCCRGIIPHAASAVKRSEKDSGDFGAGEACATVTIRGSGLWEGTGPLRR